MLKKILAVTGAASLMAASGLALAAGPVHSSNTETGSVYHGAEYARLDGKLTRVDSWNSSSKAASSADADDVYAFTGEESGWQLRPHRYDFVNGKLVHNDSFRHDTPKPRYVPDPRGPNGAVGSGA